MSDNVNNPGHYTQGDVECIDAIRASMSKEGFAAYCKGNTIKYIWRYKQKGGLEDLEKARVYLGWLIDTVRLIDQETQELARQWMERQKAKEAETA